MSEGEIVDVRCFALAFGGRAIGEVCSGAGAGKRAFIDHALPGELIRAKLIKCHERYVEGELYEIVEQAPDRIVAPCPVFSKCGGCSLQNATLLAQRRWKVDLIRSTLLTQLKCALPEIVELGPDLPGFNYRTRAVFHLSEEGKIGFFRKGSGEVVPFDNCLVLDESVATVFHILKKYSSRLGKFISSIAADSNGVALRVRENQVWESSAAIVEELAKQVPTLAVEERGKQVLTYHDGTRCQTLSGIGHFSQINCNGNKILQEAVMKLVAGDKVLDLYAGAGNLSIPLALSAKQVCAIEVDPILIETGLQEAQRLGVSDRITLINDRCERALRKTALLESIVLDPPRAGAAAVIPFLKSDKIKEIIYVSCSLPTLVRDLKDLFKQGWQVAHVGFLDMFPQTYHMEIVASWSRTPLVSDVYCLIRAGYQNGIARIDIAYDFYHESLVQIRLVVFRR